jgi:SAM-dependent methyltransferase
MTASEFAVPPPYGLLESLERFAQPRVLDFGCGYGRVTRVLLEAGFDVYGVDPAPSEIEKGRIAFSTLGLDPSRLQPIGAFEDESFDVVFSQEVLEHVDDLEAFAAEVARLTKPGGEGIHVWPARFNPVELHLHMPFVHWLPRNSLRRAMIYPLAIAGVRRERRGARPVLQWAEDQFRYSIEQTFYPRWCVVARAFDRHGLTSRRISHPKARGPGMAWAVNTFWASAIHTTKRRSRL